MLIVDSVAKRFCTRSSTVVVLRDACLTLEEGEAVAIMGPSGSGKSTLLNIVGTLEPPDEGRVTLDDVDPFALSPRELACFRNRNIGFVFQDHHLLPQCSVLENVLLPTLAFKEDRSSSTPVGNQCPTAPANVMDRARELLDRVGLTSRLDHRPAELSGGERQRVALARALIKRPTLILADEPTGNLDRDSADAIGGLLADLVSAERVMLIVVTHNVDLAARFARRFDLTDGRLVASAGEA